MPAVSTILAALLTVWIFVQVAKCSPCERKEATLLCAKELLESSAVEIPMGGRIWMGRFREAEPKQDGELSQGPDGLQATTSFLARFNADLEVSGLRDVPCNGKLRMERRGNPRNQEGNWRFLRLDSATCEFRPTTAPPVPQGRRAIVMADAGTNLSSYQAIDSNPVAHFQRGESVVLIAFNDSSQEKRALATSEQLWMHRPGTTGYVLVADLSLDEDKTRSPLTELQQLALGHQPKAAEAKPILPPLPTGKRAVVIPKSGIDLMEGPFDFMKKSFERLPQGEVVTVLDYQENPPQHVDRFRVAVPSLWERYPGRLGWIAVDAIALWTEGTPNPLGERPSATPPKEEAG